MKVLQIVDVDYWAIGKLSKAIVKHLPHIEFKTVYVHPKHVEEHLEEVRRWIDWADIVDFQYWNSARQLLEFLPELEKKKSLLTHHNEKDLLSADWMHINRIVAETKRSVDILSEIYPSNVDLIPLAIDLEFFRYNEKLPGTKTVGYCGRVVPWKGLKEIARACFELGYPLAIMGKFDKPSYWEEIPQEHRDNMDLGFMDCEDDDRIEFYKSLDIYIGNSGPGRETGTLPLMEAMACGVPVITTPSGIAADILEDHENAVLTPFNDYETLKENLAMLMENEELKEKIRRAAWNSIKNFSEEQRAWEYEKVYHKVLSDLPLVSVIIPVYNGSENLVKILASLEKSAEFYDHFEVVICDDGSNDGLHGRIPQWREIYNFPIKYVQTGGYGVEGKKYGLAEARNRGVIAAQGEYLFFCDSRMMPRPDAISVFMKAMDEFKKEKVWLFGEKGGKKLTFVENFSFIRRDYFILAGMMNERIDSYGGLSQELRTRFQWQGFQPKYIGDAIADQLSGSHMTDKRRQDIIKAKLLLWKMGLKG